MIHFDIPKQKSSIIKVLGVGGGGSNAVNYMFAEDIEGVDFIICNTDSKALDQSKVPNKIQLGPHLTQGLGAGANPEVGKQATEESLEEIKCILEVNTKMAFICAGMGGGTGTGGAPIIAKICRELGILTVAIVTTPFGFEGPRRMAQAEAGIKDLEPYVDTLLVISNDKLRIQYGNLKMKDAFGKADNVLATAAKCITDIINSRGHIIVDFADVCTVMKNGGVAILGSAAVEGEDRAQRAIEEALNSPLLNDSDIRGAKWILININSAEGEHECTMDEVEIINNHLRLQAGENTDVIVGMGYDAALEAKVGITLVATGFEHKDPFSKVPNIEVIEKPVEKIVMTLGVENEEKKIYDLHVKKDEAIIDQDIYAPSISENEIKEPIEKLHKVEKTVQPVLFELLHDDEEKEINHVEQVSESVPVERKPIKDEPVTIPLNIFSRPKHIYANMPEEKKGKTIDENQEIKPEQEAKVSAPEDPEEELQMELIIKEEVVEQSGPVLEKENIPVAENENLPVNEEEDQKKRAAERIHKLRNLSFNMNSKEASGDFETVPAYVRRNMELFGNTLTSVEQFYSKYTVKKDEKDEVHISSINTFLDGKKPD
ncbi:MAG: cell division protein FtsZ [Bacteroidetes bacterium]|nr:cell division protein FtsZ [Bacteroidota bacterium]